MASGVSPRAGWDIRDAAYLKSADVTRLLARAACSFTQSA